jgi:hypothetical protein
MSSDDRSGVRDAYEKPSLRVIDLVAEEVMAVGCKLPTTGGSFGNAPPVATCGVPFPCNQTMNVS